MKPITILLADDHMMVREGFRKLLGSESDLDVVGGAKTGREAVSLAMKLRPEVIVMDIAMPELSGLEATRQICKALPDTRILILSAHGDDAYIEQAVESGASGFLLKHSSANALSDAIREVKKGNVVFSPAIVKRFLAQKSDPRGGRLKKKFEHLTSREIEVLQLIAEGMANKQTAVELHISIKTVEKHRDNLMQKLNIHDTAGLTRYAISAGIIESSVQLTILRNRRAANSQS